jgi:hypothetical protein
MSHPVVHIVPVPQPGVSQQDAFLEKNQGNSNGGVGPLGFRTRGGAEAATSGPAAAPSPATARTDS